MAKKKHKHRVKKYMAHRNAAPRNAAPRAPRAGTAHGETSLHRLGYTAAGAGATALVGSFLAREGWAPKTIAGALAAVGAGLTWKGDSSTIKSVGAGAMSAAGSQLALMMIDDHGQKAAAPVASGKKPSNADGLPPGALERAFEQAQQRLALVAGHEAAA